MNTPQFIYSPPTKRHLGGFQVLVIIAKTAINICVTVFNSFGEIPRGAIAGYIL